VAIGLSLPYFEIPDVVLPHAIEDATPPPRQQSEHRFVANEQV
jgi:hypothetical protein